MKSSATIHQYTVVATDLNQYGIIHGGRLLTIVDEIGFLAAYKHADGDCLTLGIHQARFHQAAQINDHLVCHAQVALTGKSSMWIPVTIHTKQSTSPIMEAIMVFVAVDQQMHPRPVAPITPETDTEKQLQAKLKALRQTINKDSILHGITEQSIITSSCI